MKRYQILIKILAENIIPVRASKYFENSFGSWYIEIESNPMYRIAHDGRDKIIVLEVLKNNDWHCLSYDKTKSGKYIIEELKNELESI